MTGTFLATTMPASAATTVHGTLVGLHEAHFARWPLRLLFFLSGLLGCAMVATGLVLWTVARLPKPNSAARMPLGHRLVHALNVGTLAGLPVAVACYFLANRLLPAAMPARPEAEVQAFFAGWLLTALPVVFLAPARAWTVALTTAAAGFFAIPIVGGVTTNRHLLTSLREGDKVFVAFDTTSFCVAVGFGFAAYALANRRAAPQRMGKDALQAGIGSRSSV